MAIFYATPSGAGSLTGADWANAFSWSELSAHWVASASAGDFYYMAGGTYTMTVNVTSALDGTAALPISIIGVLSGTTNEPPIASDWAYTTNRPLIAGATYTLYLDDFWHILNLRYETTGSGLRLDSESLFFNVYSNNTYSGSGRAAFSGISGSSRFINCEGESVNGRAFQLGGDHKVFNCWAHDSEEGFLLGGTVNTIIGSIASDCSTAGIDLGIRDRNQISNNTIYNCGIGLSGGAGGGCIFISNNIVNCTTGASWTAAQLSDFWDYNNWYNNTTDVSNVTKGLNDTANNPNFEDAANGDFRLASASACRNAGMPLELGV